MKYRSPLAVALSCLVAVTLLSGCAMLGAKGQSKRLDALAVYRGTVTREAPSKAPIIVVLHPRGQTKVTFYDVLLKDGPYYLVAKPGEYEVLAFEDRNGNFILDADDPVGTLAGAPRDFNRDPEGLGSIVVPAKRVDGVTPAVDLSESGLSKVLARRADALFRVVTLDAPQFASDKAVDGLWKPADFLEQGRTGIYALEPYDSAKTPVLFIHGIGGSPREFKTLANGIDRTKFQPWFFHYPSGFSLDFNGWILAQLVEENRVRLGFTKLYVVAHSMGGLVGVSAIDRRVEEGRTDLVDLYVSISTPWGGHAAAARAPSGIAMPSWKDITPDSEFFKKMASIPVPRSVDYCLFFSHAGDSRLMSGGDDGTVTISSQLPYQVENRASLIYGFNESHSSILESDELRQKLNTVLVNEAEGRPIDTGVRFQPRK
ncbi:MAG: alpha/beta fold hydrolase [Thermoanaerobaculia bacterium]|jgi:pimeloyl-ACP methyl ester carboxylesterase